MPALTLPANLSGQRPQDAGLLAHALIGTIAPYLRELDPATLGEHILDIAGSLVNGDNHNRRRVLQLTATGHAATYLRRYAPNEPWELLDCEFNTTRGKVDVAWRHATTGAVFFDEIKTHGRIQAQLGSDPIAQARRYAEGGVALYGSLFAGVRLIPLGALHLIALVHPAQPTQPLNPTSDDPLQVGEGA